MNESVPSNTSGDARDALLDQLAHLCDEVGALRKLLDLIPLEVQEGRPLDSDPSLKEIYALLAAADLIVFEPAATRLGSTDVVQVDVPETNDLLDACSWGDDDMGAVIDRIVAARSALIEQLRALPVQAWHGAVVVDGNESDVFGFAYRITQRDAALLQAAAYRLHESRLTSREEDLPK